LEFISYQQYWYGFSSLSAGSGKCLQFGFGAELRFRSGLFLQQAVIFGASSASVGEAFFLFWVAVASGWMRVFFVFEC
jgi:hypothetical protein